MSTVTKEKSAKTSPKKVAKTAKGKKSAKKSKAKAAPKRERAKKEGLRTPQVRILAYLARCKHPVNRATIADEKNANVDLAFCNSYIGSADPETCKKNDKAVCMSLRTLGYVSCIEPGSKNYPEEARGEHYVITASGRKALVSAQKE